MRRAMLAVGLCLAITGPAYAMTAEELTNACRARAEKCQVYLSGCLDSRESFLEWHYLIEGMYCGKDDISVDKAREIFLRYAQDHPQRLNERAPTLLFMALAEALPCR